MPDKNLEQLENELNDYLEQGRQLSNNLATEVNSRNIERKKEKEKTFLKYRSSKKIQSYVIFAVCTVLMLIFYIKVFGLF